jgi:hypothetical protein
VARPGASGGRDVAEALADTRTSPAETSEAFGGAVARAKSSWNAGVRGAWSRRLCW